MAHILKGDFRESLQVNPLGAIAAVFLGVMPFWLAFDFLTGRETVLTAYSRIEGLLGRQVVWMPLALLLLINWLWNIHKGL